VRDDVLRAGTGVRGRREHQLRGPVRKRHLRGHVLRRRSGMWGCRKRHLFRSSGNHAVNANERDLPARPEAREGHARRAVVVHGHPALWAPAPSGAPMTWPLRVPQPPTQPSGANRKTDAMAEAQR
jgi:hypothetical protein